MKLKLIATDKVICFGSVGYHADGVQYNWSKQVLFYYNEFMNKVMELNKNDYKPHILQSYIKVCKRLKIIPEIRNEPIWKFVCMFRTKVEEVVFEEFNNSILESANEYVVICYDEFEKKNVFVGTDNKTRPRYTKLCKRLRLNIRN